MSTIDEVRKLLQDFIAPELSSIKVRLEAMEKIANARWEAQQSQYATLQTNMELIKAQMKNNHDAVMNLLQTRDREKVA